jgi:hypothetical protein
VRTHVSRPVLQSKHSSSSVSSSPVKLTRKTASYTSRKKIVGVR